MACRRGSVAPASARRCTIQLSRLQLVLHNLPHSSKHVDVLELMMGRSMLDGQLPSGLSAWAVPLTRAGTSSRVAGVAGRVGSMGVSLGRVPRCHGGPSRAGRGGGAFATRARYMGGGMGRPSPSVAFTHVLPRCLPTPTEEADGGGAGVLSPGGVAPGPPSGAESCCLAVPNRELKPERAARRRKKRSETCSPRRPRSRGARVSRGTKSSDRTLATARSATVSRLLAT